VKPARLRVLKLSDVWVWTAEAENLVVLGKELVSRGHEVIVGCTAGTPLAERAAAAGLEVVAVPGLRSVSPFAFAKAVSAVRRLIRERVPDVVHTYRSPVHVIASPSSRPASSSSLTITCRPPFASMSTIE